MFKLLTAKGLSFVVLMLVIADSAVAQTLSITEYPVPTISSWPRQITAGPDGALWFTEYGVNKIGRISTSGAVTEYLPVSGCSPYSPHGITGGPDGALWYTTVFACSVNSIGRMTIDGDVIEYPLPSSGTQPWQITAGPDGALWFTDYNFSKIGRISTDGMITEYPLECCRGPYGITTGPDGALWFTESNGNRIGRITTDGVVTEYPVLPTELSGPGGITTGPDGALWFAENSANKIGRITTAGIMTEYPVTNGARPWGITAGPDGALWFTESWANKIGRITTTGVITEYPTPTSNSFPLGITAGPDGNIWFTESEGNKIGRVTLILHGLDLSEIPTLDQWFRILDSYDLKFVIAGTWGGRQTIHDAYGIFTSIPTGRNVEKAAYFELNVTDAQCGPPGDVRDCTAAWQFELALTALGTDPVERIRGLKFMAIAVEPFPGQDIDDDTVFPQDLDSIAARIQRTIDAVAAIQAVGLRPVIYTKGRFWTRIAGDTNYFSVILHIPLWDTHPNRQPNEIDDLYYDSSDLGPLPWEPFGGWTGRLGKQYRIDDLSFGPVTVDRNVMSAALFPQF